MMSSLIIGRRSTSFALLQLCAFLAPEGIPDQFVSLTAPALGPVLSPIADDPVALDLAIRPLVRYSLLEREEQSGTALTTLSIHRILQLVLLDEMDEPTRQLWAERVVHATGPSHLNNRIAIALKTLSENDTVLPTQVMPEIIRWNRLLSWSDKQQYEQPQQ